MADFVANSLIDVLAHRASRTPDRRAYRFLSDDGKSEQSLAYGELFQRAKSLGAMLSLHAEPGARVLLACPPGLDFIAAFFGCQCAGMIAVPVSAPHPRRLDREWPRMESILRDCAASIVFTSSELRLRLGEVCRGAFPAVRVLCVEGDCELASDGATVSRGSSHNDLSFIQYTSGSTGAPRGVMVSQGNLLANLEFIQRTFETTENSIAVFWLPFHHDMGLIGGILEPLYCGCEATFISPLAFIHRPLRWLQLISDLKATISGGPNFAYDECVRRVSPAARASLNLSSWNVAFCGAEPIHAETLQRFATAFEGCGFQATSFLPCYGLAEATLLVTGAGQRNVVIHQRSNSEPVRVACGAPADRQVRIVSPDTKQQCPEGEVGEIWIAGDSVAQGYWGQPDVSQQTFQAQTADNDGPSLRTGDLGYISDGELYITGRLKDLIIINGRNHYPQDIERTASACHPLIRDQGCAAFSIELDQQEKLVIVAEVDPRLWVRETSNDHAGACRFADDAFAAMRRTVTDQHEVQPAQIVLVSAGDIPRTTSGKVRRRECRARFLAGRLVDVRGELMVREAQASG